MRDKESQSAGGSVLEGQREAVKSYLQGCQVGSINDIILCFFTIKHIHSILTTLDTNYPRLEG